MAKTMRQKFLSILRIVSDGDDDEELRPYADKCWGIYMRHSNVKASGVAVQALKRAQKGEDIATLIAEYQGRETMYKDIIDDVESHY